MTERRTEWLELMIRGILLAFMIAALVPDRPTRWWWTMRACQEAARRFGTLAIAAENRYRKEVE